MESIGNHFRSNSIIRAIAPFIDNEANVLDIGAGSCHVAQTLAKKHGLNVTAIDIVDHNITDFPLKIYDGKALPYKDNSFDIGLLVFVLHHAPDSTMLIQEAGRVCTKLIVVEDSPGNKFERAVWRRLDYMFNHARHADVAVAHEAKSPSEWDGLFKKYGYKVVKTNRFRSFATTGSTYPHTVFAIERVDPI